MTRKLQKSGYVDEGLIAMFIDMSPEERLAANDNAVRAILELRDGFKKQQNRQNRSKRNY